VALLQEEFTSLSDDVDLDRDRALVERCQAGDSGAFGNLYARYYERLLRFCQRRLNDRHEAEDAAQEAFARAWKALPNFAGERRFYPWLTVIAGNICTDMLRRRSRSTPTDDFELSSQQPVGSGGIETSEEAVIAAVDGELVNKALGRLSVRHRHVLAMREGSGWTYQQIADHEGVEIGTIETLLWRARQALKREFNVLAETKGALAGFLVGAGALMRRSLLRAVSRAASLPQGSGGAVRNAAAGVAVTSAAVAAAFIAPHAFSGSGLPNPIAATAPAGAAIASPLLPLAPAAQAAAPHGSAAPEATSPTAGAATSDTSGTTNSTVSATAPLSSWSTGSFGSPVVPLDPGTGSGLLIPVAPPSTPSPGSTATTSAGSGLGSATTGAVGAATSSVTSGLGTSLGTVVSGLDSTSNSGDSGSSGSGTTSAGTTTSTTIPSIGSVTKTVTNLGSTLLGQG
jgi:RNA polymerase sigma-70 factor, ECF subfamily